MLKTSFVAVVFLALGAYASELYRNQFSSINSSNNSISDTASMPIHSVLAKGSSQVAMTNLDKLPVKHTKVDISIFKSPKTPFELFEVLSSLTSASAEELKEYISSLGMDKLEARRQVAWLLAGKYPDEALDFLTTLMNSNDLDVAKLVLQGVAQNHAKLAWDWIKANENEMDKMFSSNIVSIYEFKMFVLNWLALVPEQKWVAYEQVQVLTANGPRKGDKYNVLSVAVNAANSDPEDAINRSMSSANGSPDPLLFNGAVSAIIEKDLPRAKDLVLQNQDLAQDSSVSKIAYQLMQNNRFNEAYSFVNSLTKPELKGSAISTVSDRAIVNGLERSKEFVNTISSDELRAETVSSMVIKMAVSGQPIRDQIALMDSALGNIPIEKKSFSYAYTVRDWAKLNPTEYNNYMSDLRLRDKPLADAMEINSTYIQKK